MVTIDSGWNSSVAPLLPADCASEDRKNIGVFRTAININIITMPLQARLSREGPILLDMTLLLICM